MKRVFFTYLLLLFIPVLTVLNGCKDDNNSTTIKGGEVAADTVRIDTLKEVVMRVRQQSRLYTTECQVHKVVLYTDNAKLGGKLLDITIPGDRKVAIPIDVTLKGYVDFSQFSPSNVKMADSLCIITLPDPQVIVTASKVDHKNTRQYVSMTRSRFSETEISELTAQGEDTIVSHITNYGIVEQSRESCARVLVPILQKMGFKDSNVIIRFRKNYNDSELQRLASYQK